MSGILNKLGLGHKDHTDASHTDASHHSSTGHARDGTATTTTSTTTTNNSGLNNSGLSSGTAPYGSSTNTSTTRSGAAYSGTGVANQGLASQGINQSGHITGEDAMTRSEEQLRVAKATVETGKAELNKTVEKVHVEQAVPVQKERVVIEREPITQSNMPAAMSGPAISEAHYETTLKEDRVAATKETVPIERIRLAKQTETSVQSVGADLAKEHVDLTLHNMDNAKTDGLGRTGAYDSSKTDTFGRSNIGHNDKFDTGARSGISHDNSGLHSSGITHGNNSSLHNSSLNNSGLNSGLNNSSMHSSSNPRNI